MALASAGSRRKCLCPSTTSLTRPSRAGSQPPTSTLSTPTFQPKNMRHLLVEFHPCAPDGSWYFLAREGKIPTRQGSPSRERERRTTRLAKTMRTRRIRSCQTSRKSTGATQRTYYRTSAGLSCFAYALSQSVSTFWERGSRSRRTIYRVGRQYYDSYTAMPLGAPDRRRGPATVQLLFVSSVSIGRLLTSLLAGPALVALGPRWGLGRLGEPPKPLNAKTSGQIPGWRRHK